MNVTLELMAMDGAKEITLTDIANFVPSMGPWMMFVGRGPVGAPVPLYLFHNDSLLRVTILPDEGDHSAGPWVPEPGEELPDAGTN